MKKLIFYCLLWGLAAFVPGCRPAAVNRGYTITGTVSGNADGKKVYLVDADKPGTRLDSTVIKDHSFEFKDTVDYPHLYDIVIVKNEPKEGDKRPPFQPVIPLFIENADIQISAPLDSIPTQLDAMMLRYSYKNIKITGSAANDLYLDYYRGKSALDKKWTTAFDEYIDYLNPPQGKEKGPVSEGIALVSRVDDVVKERNDYLEQFIKGHPASPVALYVAKEYLRYFSVNEINDILAGISPEAKATAAGKALTERADEVKKTATGAEYADFSFQDDKGNPVKLSDRVGKGKYVLLEFWASWCGPCRADIPHLKEVYDLYHPAGFEVISISMDDDKQKWLQAVKEEQMKWLQVSDLKAFKGNLSKLYNFNGIPTCVLIDPNGKIVTRNMRGSWMDKKLIELYGNKFGDKY